MRKLLGALAVILAVAAFGPAAARAQEVGEHIQDFSARIVVEKSGLLDVTETITYDFGGTEHHGIYRDIPLTYNAGKERIDISNVTAADASGTLYQTAVSHQGDFERIQIGDPNVLVTGVHVYVIAYEADGAVQWGADADRIVWNATGDGWQVPIDRAEASLTLPLAAPGQAASLGCYEGVYGSTEACAINGVSMTATRALRPGEGLGFALTLPKGVLTPPTPAQRFWKFFFAYWPLLIPFVVFAYMFRKWWKNGRDPKGRGTIIAEYEPPAGLTPIECGALAEGQIKPALLSAEIISLAVRGFLKITPIENGLLHSRDYTLDKLKEPGDTEPPHDRLLLDSLFAAGPSVTLSSMKQKFSAAAVLVQTSVYQSLVAKGYYDSDPRKVAAKYMGVTFLVGFGSVFLLRGWLAGLAAGVVSAIIIAIFGIIMPRLTEKGALEKEAILGFREYLDIAEKDRLNFHDAPEKTPELFEKFLPYALALGVVDAWAKEFEGIYTQPPSWYGGTGSGGGWNGAFAATAFAHELSGFNAAASHAIAAGSAGRGGGGFAGGGAGGGGGGSW